MSFNAIHENKVLAKIYSSCLWHTYTEVVLSIFKLARSTTKQKVFTFIPNLEEGPISHSENQPGSEGIQLVSYSTGTNHETYPAHKCWHFNIYLQDKYIGELECKKY